MKLFLLLLALHGTQVGNAAGMHLGVPFDAIEGLDPPEFQTSESGWTAAFSDGLLRVYIAQSEEAAAEWILRALELVARDRPSPLAGVGDEAHGDGVGLAIVRDGNVAMMVRAPRGARDIALQILGSMEEGEEAWPAAPALFQVEDGTWQVLAPGAVHMAYEGGQLDLARPGLQFTRPPRAVVAWDSHGRAVRQEFDDEGAPVVNPPTTPTEAPGEAAP